MCAPISLPSAGVVVGGDLADCAVLYPSLLVVGQLVTWLIVQFCILVLLLLVG